jgi:DNA-binding SARP family transcriptional activator/tetratricopeptide (TPR) repeat protein
MARLALTLLGGFQARLASGPPLALPTKKIQALLAYLALPAGREHARDKLAALLWGELSQGHARNSLRQALFALRQAVAPVRPACLRVEGATIALTPDAVDVDAATFERLVGERTPEALAQAVELYRGDLLDGITLQEPPFEEWLMGERERLRELAVEALAGLLAFQRAAWAADAALQTGLRLIALDPLQESVHRTLMRLYAQLGRRATALRQYQICVGVLRRELGVEPEADTRRLYEEILQRRRPREPDGGTAHDLGAPAALPPPPVIGAIQAPLIGRAHEMTRLRELLTQARLGRGRLAAVIGEAGVGKTRLAAEIAAEACGEGARVFVGRCYESDQILPFGPWVDAFRGAELTKDAALLAGLHPAWRIELARLLPEVDTTGLPARRGSDLHLFEGVAQVIEQLTARQPLLFILEDLHWADEMSLRLLQFINRRIAAWRALLLTTVRDEELADAPRTGRTFLRLSGEPHTVVVPLAPLSRSETLSLIQSLTRIDRDAAEMACREKQVWAASEGNPFIAVETLRALQEGAVLQDSSMPLSQRVRDLVADRLERLSERARQLAAVAAVIGRRFDFALLQAASRIDEAAAGVEELVRRRILHGEGERFDFTHDRIRAIALTQLLLPQRRLLHLRIAEAMETLWADRLEPHYLALGIHYREAEVWVKAVAYLRLAGLAAVTSSAYREAAASFAAALAVLEHLPQDREWTQMALDLHLHMREALNALGEIEAMVKHLRHAEALARDLGDQRRLSDSLCNSTKYLIQVGDHRRALESANRALALGETIGDFGVLVVANNYLAQSTWALGDVVQAKRLYSRFVDRFEAAHLHDRFGMTGQPAVLYQICLGACQAELGEFREAVDRGERGLKLAQEIDRPFTLSNAYLWLGRIYVLQGTLPRAVCLLERSLDIAQKRQLGGWAHYAPGAALGHALALSGRVADALRLLKGAEEDAMAARTCGRLSLFVTWLGEAHLLGGQFDDAAGAARRALALASRHQERGHEAWAYRLLGEVAANREPPDPADAEHGYREALDLAAQLGMRPLAAHCHVGLGKLYRRTGQRQEAHEYLSTAMTMYREMDMRFWLEKAETEIGWGRSAHETQAGGLA